MTLYRVSLTEVINITEYTDSHSSTVLYKLKDNTLLYRGYLSSYKAYQFNPINSLQSNEYSIGIYNEMFINSIKEFLNNDN